MPATSRRVTVLDNGRRIAQFSLSTTESYLDAEGNVKDRKQWHKISAWGVWVSVIEHLGAKGLKVAIEGKLISRFYQSKDGNRKMVTEIEVNDLVIL